MSPIVRIERLFIALTGILFPLKLTLGYIGLIPLVSWWLFHNFRGIPKILKEAPQSLRFFAAFVLVTALTSLFGMDVKNSILHFGTLFFFPLTILCFWEYTKKYPDVVITSLLIGSALSASMTILYVLFPESGIPHIGPVSQSGQFAVLFFVTIFATTRYPQRAISISVVAALIVIGLILNLKRGPWFGVATAASILLLYYQNRRSLLLFLLTVAILATQVPPITDRLNASLGHFFIAGGRSEIWNIGVELISKYPLGIGFENSGILRDFSAEIPKNLKHFHSNYLNIWVETGYLGITLFVAFLCSLFREVRFAIKKENTSQVFKILLLGCSVLAWSIAGIVEYNFGDSAVVSVLYITLGMYYAQLEHSRDIDEKTTSC